jgi:TRAP-type C4-dicarboxylate transport system permease small subunit
MKVAKYNKVMQLAKNKIDISDLVVILALILLAYAAFLIYQKQELDANQIAKYAYYILVIGISWKVIQYVIKTIKDRRKKENRP